MNILWHLQTETTQRVCTVTQSQSWQAWGYPLGSISHLDFRRLWQMLGKLTPTLGWASTPLLLWYPKFVAIGEGRNIFISSLCIRVLTLHYKTPSTWGNTLFWDHTEHSHIFHLRTLKDWCRHSWNFALNKQINILQIFNFIQCQTRKQRM